VATYELRLAESSPVDAPNQQYSLARILGIWALAALPMALLAWVVGPALFPLIPLHPGLVYWMLMILGMAWQFAVSLVILRRELGGLRWNTVRRRTWLNLPRDPSTGAGKARLFWWVIPCLLFAAVIQLIIGDYLDAPLHWLLPSLNAPAYTDTRRLVDPQFRGQWWIFGVALVSLILNYFLGEKLLFRGILLPKMAGVFGKWDWVANAALFGLYHLHRPWHIPAIIAGALAITWPARHFRSTWMAVIVHGTEGLFIVLVLAVILGLIP
jgi:membrane protease YdiL (CAAX protease family)